MKNKNFVTPQIEIIMIDNEDVIKTSCSLREKISNFSNINIGDDKETVLQIYGKCPNISKLKDGREKYEWTLKQGCSSRIYVKGTGMSFGNYSGVKKVTIYFKDNKVVETKGLNLG